MLSFNVVINRFSSVALIMISVAKKTILLYMSTENFLVIPFFDIALK